MRGSRRGVRDGVCPSGATLRSKYQQNNNLKAPFSLHSIATSRPQTSRSTPISATGSASTPRARRRRSPFRAGRARSGDSLSGSTVRAQRGPGGVRSESLDRVRRRIDGRRVLRRHVGAGDQGDQWELSGQAWMERSTRRSAQRCPSGGDGAEATARQVAAAHRRTGSTGRPLRHAGRGSARSSRSSTTCWSADRARPHRRGRECIAPSLRSSW